jgi:hypothetical protein
MPGEQDLANTLDAIINEQEHWGHVAGQGCPRDANTGQRMSHPTLTQIGTSINHDVCPSALFCHSVPIQIKSGEQRFCLLTGCNRTTILDK